MKYEDTDEVNKLVRKSFLELLDVCNLVKLLSIRNADKIRSLLEVISNEEITIVNSSELVKNEIGEQKYNSIIDSIKKGYDKSLIASLVGIDIEKIKIIADNL